MSHFSASMFFSFFRFADAGIANHGKAARQISFRQFRRTAACLRHAHDADTVIGTQLSDDPRIFFNPFQVYFQPGIHMPPPEKAHPVNFRNELFSTKLLFPVFHFVKIQTHVSRTEDRIPAFLFWRS